MSDNILEEMAIIALFTCAEKVGEQILPLRRLFNSLPKEENSREALARHCLVYEGTHFLKIRSIKKLREVSRVLLDDVLGLKEAKDLIESVMP